MSSQPPPSQPSSQKKSTSSSQPLKKISIKQFEWYEVETKVRELLTQLLQPFTKKQTQDTVKMNQFKRTLTTMGKKLDDHDFLLTQENAQKPTYVQLQDNKIQQINNKFIELQIQQNRKIEEMRKIIEVYQGKILQMNRLETKVQEQIKQRNTNFKQHKLYTDGQIQLMLKKLDNQDGDINNFRQVTRNTITKLETRTVVVENRVNAIEDQLKRKTQQLKRINDQIVNMNQKLAATDLSTKELDTRLTQREKDYKLSQKFMSKAIQLQNSVSFITNYLQFYQPLYNQIQISETINSFLKGSMKTRACVFEEKIYAQMHYAILSTEEQNLQTKMSQYSNRIRRIINRNKKYLIRMKVEQTLKYGNNVYEIRELDEGMLQKSEELTNKPPTIIVPEDQIIKIVEQKWQKIVNSVEHKINQKTEPFKIWIKQLQQQSLMREIDIQKRGLELKQRIQKQQISTQLCKSQVQQLQKQLQKSFEYFGRQVKKSRQQIKDIINFSSVINHIVIQDQIDRQGLALYALKSNTHSNAKGEQSSQQAYPNIHLDQKCVSCQNGNANMIVNQAFKMACLAYNPSEIKVDDKVFSREEILEISTNILDKLKKKLDELQPERKESITQNNARNVELKNRSKSLVNKQLNTTFMKNNDYTTIDTVPSRLRDTTYLLPVLGAVKKKSIGPSTHRDKVSG